MKPILCAGFVSPILAAVALIAVSAPANAERRFEAGSHFTFLHVGQRAPGFGGTFSYDFTRRFALESTLNFFPGDPSSDLGSRIRPILGGWNLGNILQGHFGARAIILRSRKAEFFFKAKPGFVSFSDLRYSGIAGLGGSGGAFIAPVGRQTSFALDVGGGAEFYPSRTTFLRFDIGDTYFRYNSFTTTMNTSGLSGAGILPIIGFHGSSVHTLQISTGVGLRFGRAR